MNRFVSVKLLSFATVLLLVGVNVSSAAVLFEDNFDNVAVGEAPVAQTGYWGRVENVVADTIATPPSGTQYLEVPRPSKEENAKDDHWGQTVVVPEAGTALHAEFYLNVEDSVGFLPQFGLWGAGENSEPGAWPNSYGILLSLFNGDDFTNTYTVANYDGVDHIDTGLIWTPDVWEKWEIDYVVGESSYELTVGANAATVYGALTPGLVQGVYFITGDAAGTYGVDDVLVSVDIPVVIPGDANNDGIVNYVDATALAANWLTLTDATWEMGDFNGDGAVDDLDAALLATNWQVGTAAAVPEPGSMSLFLAVLVSLGLVRISPRSE